MIECQRRHQIYTGEKWLEREPRVVIPAVVLDVDDKFVYLQRTVRKTKVRIDRFLRLFDKVAHTPGHELNLELTVTKNLKKAPIIEALERISNFRFEIEQPDLKLEP